MKKEADEMFVEKAVKVVERLIEKKIKITTMESCTGGFLISTITDVEGASNITDGGFVTYSNNQKIAVGVPEEVIETYGVYSSQTAFQMAQVCREKMKAHIGVGITGTLSNVDINNTDSVQGEVYFCIAFKDMVIERKIKVPVESRHSQKEFIVDKIFDEMLKAI